MGFSIGNVTHPTLWFEEGDEPVFFIVREGEKAYGLVNLDYIRDTMQAVHDGDLDKADAYTYLYVLVPGNSGLRKCFATIGGTADSAELIITGYTDQPLWRCVL